MNNIIEVSSPLTYKVVCTNEQWNNHILGNHPNMKNRERLVADCISNPLVVYQSDGFPNRDVYFAESRIINDKLKYVKVIVENDNAENAHVVSAWMQPKIAGNISKGAMKYVKSKL